MSSMLAHTLILALELLKFGPVATSIFLDHFSSALGHWFLLILYYYHFYILLFDFSALPLVLVFTRILSSIPF